MTTTIWDEPVRPEDPNAEYLTIQETAHVFRCSVKTLRRKRKELGLGARVGTRIVFSREDRAALFDANRIGTPAYLAQRRHKPAKRVPAQRAAA